MNNLEKLVKLKVLHREALINANVNLKQFFNLSESEQQKVLANLSKKSYHSTVFSKGHSFNRHKGSKV